MNAPCPAGLTIKFSPCSVGGPVGVPRCGIPSGSSSKLLTSRAPSNVAMYNCEGMWMQGVHRCPDPPNVLQGKITIPISLQSAFHKEKKIPEVGRAKPSQSQPVPAASPSGQSPSVICQAHWIHGSQDLQPGGRPEESMSCMFCPYWTRCLACF